MKRFVAVYKFSDSIAKGYFENQLKRTFKELEVYPEGETFFLAFSCNEHYKEVKSILNNILTSLTALDPTSDYIAVYFIRPESESYIDKIMLLGREIRLDADLRKDGHESVAELNNKVIGDLLACPGEVMVSGLSQL